MKKENTKKLILFSILAITILSLTTNIVYAATSSTIALCDYAGVRRAFKIAGIIIIFVKIIVPLLIIITGMIAFAKPIMSGKTEDLTQNAVQLVKKFLAGIAIFYIPTIIDFAFNLVPNYDESSMSQCTTCLFDPDGCTIPTSDPKTYTEDK